jgi:hypothetical protein
MTHGKQISRTEYVVPKTEQSCSTMVRANSIVAQPIKVEIQTVTNTSESHRIGRHTRKTDGRLYTSPRLLLPRTLTQHIGTRCRIFQTHGSVTSNFWNLHDKDILIVVLLPP